MSATLGREALSSEYLLVVTMVIFSLGFQLAAAGLALRLIPVTGKKASWSCVAGALVLMAFRRLYSLRAALVRGAELSVPFEVTGLLLSLLILLGFRADRLPEGEASTALRTAEAQVESIERPASR